MNKIIHERLSELRLAHGYSQKLVSITVGVAGPTVSQWESGQKTPSQKSIEKLADLYGVSVDYLIGRSDEIAPQQMFDSGEALHSTRLAHNMSLSDIGIIAKVGPQTVARWEQNKPKAPTSKLRVIAEALNIPLKELIGDQPEKTQLNIVPFEKPKKHGSCYRLCAMWGWWTGTGRTSGI